MPTSSARTLKGPRRLQPPSRPPLAEPAVAVPARLPEESGDGRIGDPVEPGPDRQDAEPVDWENTQLFVEYGPGVGTFTRPMLDRLGAGREADRRSTPTPTSRTISRRRSTIRGWSPSPDRRPTSRRSSPTHGFGHADYVLSGLPFSTLPPGVGEAIARSDGRR